MYVPELLQGFVLQGAQADLAVSDIKVPFEIEVNVEHTITVCVLNSGGAKAEGFSVNLTITEMPQMVETEHWKKEKLFCEAKAILEVDFFWLPKHLGNYRLTAFADCDNSVEELNETNNELYVDVEVKPTTIAFSITLIPTCPEPFVNSSTPRCWEPVYVTAKPLTSGVENAILSYRVDGSEWWNTTMIYNETNGLWSTTIPGQPGNSAVEFFLTAYDKTGNKKTTQSYSYAVKDLIVGDLNGDGTVNIIDIATVARNFGKTAD
jgi:hypothetical protein